MENNSFTENDKILNCVRLTLRTHAGFICNYVDKLQITGIYLTVSSRIRRQIFSNLDMWTFYREFSTHFWGRVKVFHSSMYWNTSSHLWNICGL